MNELKRWFQGLAPVKVISSDEQIGGPFSEMAFASTGCAAKIGIINHDTEF